MPKQRLRSATAIVSMGNEDYPLRASKEEAREEPGGEKNKLVYFKEEN